MSRPWDAARRPDGCTTRYGPVGLPLATSLPKTAQGLRRRKDAAASTYKSPLERKQPAVAARHEFGKVRQARRTICCDDTRERDRDTEVRRATHPNPGIYLGGSCVGKDVKRMARFPTRGAGNQRRGRSGRAYRKSTQPSAALAWRFSLPHTTEERGGSVVLSGFCFAVVNERGNGFFPFDSEPSRGECSSLLPRPRWRSCPSSPPHF